MESKNDNSPSFRSYIWAPIITMILVIIGIMAYAILGSHQLVYSAPLEDFDQMVVTNGFHNISVPSGQRFELSYEANHDRYFDGVVNHVSMNHEDKFPILSFDILVTTGDYSDKNLVYTHVENHHFTWRSLTGTPPNGTINLLHIIPMNQEIEEQLEQIKVGDHVAIKGWDILKVDAYDTNGEYIGYWQDAGCNTTLVTVVYINP